MPAGVPFFVFFFECRWLELQSGLAARDALVLQLFGTGLVLAEDLDQGAGADAERLGGGLGVAVLGGHDVKNVGYEQRKLRVARLDMPVAPREGNLVLRGSLADVQGECHLHPVQCMGLIFLGASPFAGFDF